MSLDILIVGGGIGGLAAAAGFRKDGHRVIVLEQAAQLTEVGAAIGMGPNATGCLWRLGVSRALGGRSRAACVRGRTAAGSTAGFSVRMNSAMQRKHVLVIHSGMLHRADLHKSLFSAATDPALPGDPADVRLGMRVTTVTGHLGRVDVETADGQDFTADLVIGRRRRSLAGSREHVGTR